MAVKGVRCTYGRWFKKWMWIWWRVSDIYGPYKKSGEVARRKWTGLEDRTGRRKKTYHDDDDDHETNHERKDGI